MCKKHKLNITVNDNTYPSLSKAIQQNKIELDNNFYMNTLFLGI